MGRLVFRGGAAGFVTLAVLAAVATRAGLIAPLPSASGPGLWAFSRAAGLTALAALTVELSFGLFLSTGLADRWVPRARSAELHTWLSSVTLALIGAHAMVLLGDRFVRFDALDVLVPFLAPYRPVAVGLGIVAAYAALVVDASFALRKHLGPGGWRKVHYASFAVFAVAVLHGLLAGTDATRPWMLAFTVTCAAVVGSLALVRVFTPRRASRAP